MGLDMFMQKQTDFFQSHLQLMVDGEIVNASRLTSIIESVGYWRDFYPMHEWIVDNVQGGKDDKGRYWMGDDDIQELIRFLEGEKDMSEAQFPEMETTISQLKSYLTEDNITEFASFYYQGI